MVLLGLEMHITYKNSHLVYLRSAIGDQRSSLFFVVPPPPPLSRKSDGDGGKGGGGGNGASLFLSSRSTGTGTKNKITHPRRRVDRRVCRRGDRLSSLCWFAIRRLRAASRPVPFRARFVEHEQAPGELAPSFFGRPAGRQMGKWANGAWTRGWVV